MDLGKAEFNINHFLSDIVILLTLASLLHEQLYKGCDEVMVVWIYPYMSILALRCIMGTSDVITFPAKLLFKEINISYFLERNKYFSFLGKVPATQKTCYRLSFNHMYVIASFVIQRHYIFSGGQNCNKKLCSIFLKTFSDIKAKL